MGDVIDLEEYRLNRHIEKMLGEQQDIEFITLTHKDLAELYYEFEEDLED
jgi:hypothetical protein